MTIVSAGGEHQRNVYSCNCCLRLWPYISINTLCVASCTGKRTVACKVERLLTLALFVDSNHPCPQRLKFWVWFLEIRVQEIKIQCPVAAVRSSPFSEHYGANGDPREIRNPPKKLIEEPRTAKQTPKNRLARGRQGIKDIPGWQHHRPFRPVINLWIVRQLLDEVLHGLDHTSNFLDEAGVQRKTSSGQSIYACKRVDVKACFEYIHTCMCIRISIYIYQTRVLKYM